MPADVFYVLNWWFVFFLIGIIFLPLTFFLFEKFYDKGYILSRAIGLVIVSFILWLLSSFKIISYSATNMTVVLFVCLILNALFVWRKWNYFKNVDYKKLIVPIIISEFLFIVTLAFWSYVRGHQPKVEGIEKFFDHGFIAAILRADYMPAVDMWYAGAGMNYYYFGHFICATLIKTVGVASEVGYNLLVATLFATMFSFAYSITSNIMHRRKVSKWIVCASGIISAFTIAFGSNLHTFFEGVIGNLMKGKAIFEGYWYPDVTRYVGYEGSFLPNFTDADKCIHEMPAYAALLGDLHAHFIGLFIVLPLIALMIAFVFRTLDDVNNYEWWKLSREMPLFVLFLACAYTTNTWDFPMYLMLLGLALWMVNIKKYGCTKAAFGRAFAVGVGLGVAAMILDIPYHLTQISIAQGISSGIPNMAITAPDKFLILWGHYLFMTGALLWVLIRECAKVAQPKIKPKLLKNLQKKQKSGFWSKANIRCKELMSHVEPGDLVAMILAVCAIILIYIPEVVYIKDIYGGGTSRANTMFKFAYQAYIMFMLIVGYAFFRILGAVKEWKVKWWLPVCMTLVVVLPLLYNLPKPFGGFALESSYGKIFSGNYKSLDGLSFFETESQYNTDDRAAVYWLRENVVDQTVILEAPGLSFTKFCRISASTGLPTIAGWESHEWLWRGDYDALKARYEEIETVYESGNIAKTKEILRKYNVKYIIIGEMEREKYPKLDEEKLRNLGEVVLDRPLTKIIAVRI